MLRPSLPLIAVCGLDELAAYRTRGITHILSILDPDRSEPEIFQSFRPHTRQTVRLHDEITQGPGLVLPQRAHIEQVVAFGTLCSESTTAGTDWLVHCHMGLSRSTAATAIMLAAIYSTEAEEMVFAHVLRLRPDAWPNLLMVTIADELLGRAGRFVSAAGRVYASQLARRPELAAYMRKHGRGSEIDLGERHESYRLAAYSCQ
jgi:predicted protein tyrosine phosphatase